jgi:quercetin 2,3-dioxygenase
MAAVIEESSRGRRSASRWRTVTTQPGLLRGAGPHESPPGFPCRNEGLTEVAPGRGAALGHDSFERMTERAVTEVIAGTNVPDLTWVESRRVFLDPKRCQDWDPFILWGDDWFRKPGGFPDHPHRGFETVTYLFEGAVVHTDSRGNTGELHAGDVQWMTAGRGVIHSEMPVGDAPVHAMQLWLNLPAADKMTAPRYQDLRADSVPSIREPGLEIKIFSGTVHGVTAPTLNHVPMTMLDIRIDSDVETTLELPASDRIMLFVAEGSLRLGAERVEVEGDHVAHFAPAGDRVAGDVRVLSTKRSHALLIAAPPLGEPVVFGGPFVMNTPGQIEQARADLAAGRLVD